MKDFRLLVTLVLGLMLLAFVPTFAQGGQPGGGGCINPDSLVLVTVSGTAIVDTTTLQPTYYLDENGDGNADYFLNFGPYWYTPDSSAATRPNDGDAITIYGGQHDPIYNTGTLPVVIVYEINGLFWRDPFEPFWSNVGQGGHHMSGGHHAFGWMHDTLETVTLSGVAMVDTTILCNQYFLDVDQDSIPDYFLNFGPPWYEPTSGATRPENGETIDIVGGLTNSQQTLPVVIVYEINGLVWRDSTIIGGNFGGGWIHQNMTQSQYFYAPWDTLCGLNVNPGWQQSGPHGNMMPDSIFCQMLQLYPQNMPNIGNQNAFAGFEFGMFGPNGQNMMMGGMMGGQLQFNNQVQFRFHYNNIQIQGNNINENTVQLKSWDESTDTWVTVSNAVVNTSDNTVTLSSNDMSGFYILTGEDNPLSIEDSQTLVAKGFVMDQNYPNPFNPSTTISFELRQASHVALSIYNVLGQKVAVLLNGKMEAGQHSVVFDAKNMTSGIYFYELKVDGNSQVRKMNLMK